MVKRNQLSILAISLMTASPALLAETFNVDSHIQEVIVYPEQAYLTRQAKIHLPVGEHRLVFSNLSEQVESQSLQFKANGSAPLTLIGVEEQQIEKDKIKIESLEKIKTRLKEAEQAKQKVIDQIRVLDGQLELISQLQKNIASSERPFNLEEVKQVQQFSRQSQAQLLEEQLGLSDKLSEQDKLIAEINNELEKEKEKQFGRNKQVVVRVRASKEGDYTLGLNYINYGVSWVPSYQLFFDSNAKKIQLKYTANITQNTNEDWENVNVKLSTGRPVQVGEVPEVSPWFIDYYQPPMRTKRMVTNKGIAGSQAMEATVMAAAPAQEEAAGVVSDAAIVQDNQLAVTFEIKHKINLLSKEESQAIEMQTSNQDVEVVYAYYPQQQDKVLVTVKGENKSEYPLLAGELQTYFDGQFVGQGSLPTIYTGQKFTQLVGEDQKVVVKKSPLKRLEETSGVINKTKKLKFVEEVTLTNSHPEAIELVINERIPSSRQKDIIVTLQSPNSNDIKMDQFGRYQQTIKLGPKVDQVVKKEFTIEYPADKNINTN
ncbi:mucoidy inhibitor MuiA family protein [Pelistega sp. MC2]|uniref:mucoidy inhibitor MuiA family protein n=1 Tax=Pelistega sp. MC2 TaxID=1720297 RepID=UPI00116007AC|nr:mucoidy inhibitor MuiA family protein [Pelistega sp. MC2]